MNLKGTENKEHELREDRMYVSILIYICSYWHFKHH